MAGADRRTNASDRVDELCGPGVPGGIRHCGGPGSSESRTAGTSHYYILIPSILTQVGSLGLPTAATYSLANADYNSHEILRAIRGPAVALAVSLVPLQLLLISLLFQGDAPIAEGITLAATPGIFCVLFGIAFLQGLRQFRLFNLVWLAPVCVYAGVNARLALDRAGGFGPRCRRLRAIGVVATGLVALFVGTRKVLSHSSGGNSRSAIETCSLSDSRACSDPHIRWTA